MALVIIQVQDNPNGQTDVRVVAEPHLAELKTTDPAAFTTAQHLGAVALNAIQAELKDLAPKLVVVGADGLPH